MSAPRVSYGELDALETWAKTLPPTRCAQVLYLIQEARDHRKLQAELHDELINEMS